MGKRKLNRIAYLAFVATLMLVSHMQAEIAPLPGTQNMAQLFRAADAVCLCTVLNLKVTQQSTTDGQRTVTTTSYKAMARVDREYKGTPSRTIIIAFVVQQPATSTMPIVELGETAVLFLRHQSDDGYGFSDRFFGVFDLRGATTVSEGVGLNDLEHDAASSLTGSTTDIRHAFAILLGYEKIDEVTENRVLSVQAQVRADAKLRAERLAILMATGKPRYYQQALDLITNTPLSVPAADQFIIAARIQTASPKVPNNLLNQFSFVPIFALQLSALEAIRQRKAVDSVPTLVKHLDDSNALTRYIAIITLSEIVPLKDGFNPSMPEFERDPSIYSERWKAWWEESGRQQFLLSE